MAQVAHQQVNSYAQRYEDMHLLRAFGEQASGFYIDIGAGHPVYDNVSFAFYLRGWSGITVEPNPWLAQLSKAVRPRDVRAHFISSGWSSFDAMATLPPVLRNIRIELIKAPNSGEAESTNCDLPPPSHAARQLSAKGEQK